MSKHDTICAISAILGAASLTLAAFMANKIGGFVFLGVFLLLYSFGAALAGRENDKNPPSSK